MSDICWYEQLGPQSLPESDQIYNFETGTSYDDTYVHYLILLLIICEIPP